MSQPRVEILYFEGCPNHEGVRVLIERIGAGLRMEPHVELVVVADPDGVRKLRFLGSPTVRVNGRGVEPDAEARRDFVLSCRVYPTEQGTPLRERPNPLHRAGRERRLARIATVRPARASAPSGSAALRRTYR